MVKKEEKYGFIDPKGNIIIPCIYNERGYFTEGLAFLEGEEISGFFNKEGNIVIDFSNTDWITKSSFHGGLASIKERGQYHLINKQGSIVFSSSSLINPVYFDTSQSPLLRMTIEGRQRIIDENRNTIIPYIFDQIGVESEGYVTFEMWNKWGFMDLNQKIISLPVYDELKEFSEGLCAYKESGKWGFIDTSGKIKIPVLYDNAQNFSQGFATVLVEKKWLVIDKMGLIVKEPTGSINFSQWENRSYPEGDFKDKTRFNRDGYALVKDKSAIVYLNKEFQFVYHPYLIDKADVTNNNLPRFAYVTTVEDYESARFDLIDNEFASGSDVIVIKKEPHSNGSRCLILTENGSEYWISEENIEYNY